MAVVQCGKAFSHRASYFHLQRWALSLCLLCVMLSRDGHDLTSAPGPAVYSFPKKALPLVFPFLIIAATIPAFGMKHKPNYYYTCASFLQPLLFCASTSGTWNKEVTFSNIYTHSLGIRKTQQSV